MRLRNRKGKFVKDDYVGDLMEIAAGSLGLIKLAKAGTRVAELPDVEHEAAQAAGGVDEAWYDLECAGVGATDVHVAIAAWKEELAVT